MDDSASVIPFKVLEGKIKKEVEEEVAEEGKSVEDVLEEVGELDPGEVFILCVNKEGTQMHTFDNLPSSQDVLWLLEIFKMNLLQPNS